MTMPSSRRGNASPSSTSTRSMNKRTQNEQSLNRYLPLQRPEKAMFFATEWHFKPQGVTEIRLQFEQRMTSLGLLCLFEYVGDGLWLLEPIEGSPHRIAFIFKQIIAQLIRAEHMDQYFSDTEDLVGDEVVYYESSDDDDDGPSDQDEPEKRYKSDKLARLSAVKRAHAMLTSTTANISSLASSELSSIQQAYFPDEIKAYSVRDTLIYNNSSHILQEFASAWVLKELEGLLECTIIADLPLGRLYIGAHVIEAKDKAMRKLSTLYEYAQRLPVVRHYLYTESEERVQFEFKWFVKARRSFFRTTLLDELRMSPGNNYTTLQSAVTIRLLIFDKQKQMLLPFKGSKDVAASADPNQPPVTREWKGFRYSSKTNMATSSTQIQPGTFDSKSSGSIRAIEQPGSSEEYAAGEVRAAKGVSEKLPRHSHAANAGASQSSFADAAHPEISDNVQQSILPNSGQPHLAPSQFQKSINAAFDDMDLDQFMTTRPSTLIDLDIPALGIPALEPFRASVLLEVLSESSAPVKEFHNTMNQKTSKRSKNSSPKGSTSSNNGYGAQKTEDPLAGFIKVVRQGLEDALQSLRGFRGDVQVRAEFGRIILNGVKRANVSTEDVREQSREQTLESLTIDSRIRKSFTKILTTSAGDVQYLRDLPYKGKPMWDTRLDWKTSYECHFQNQLGQNYPLNSFTIEIDAENFEPSIRSPRCLSELFVHGTKRQWDFRIVAIGNETRRDREELYGDLANAIQSSLYIPEDLQIPELLFSVPATLLPFGLAPYGDCHVRRTSSFQSQDRKSLLHVSEVQCLQLSMDVSVPETYQFEAKCRPGSNFRWYEVSVSSPEIDELLVGNQTLELGEECIWVADSTAVDAALATIFLPACEMLKDMDGVGTHNNNGVDIIPPPSQDISPPEETGYSFW